jgi:hypothetical protein
MDQRNVGPPSVGRRLSNLGGLTQELFDEWDMSIPELRERLERIAAGIGMKAWRFVGQMEKIASTYSDAGLPEGFHLAVADLYSRLADLKDHPRGQLPGNSRLAARQVLRL